MIERFRLLGAPSKVEFLRNGMNVIDVLAVVPYYVELTMAQVDTSGGVRGAGGHNTTALDTLEVNQLFVNITPASGSVHDLCIRLNQNKEVNHVQVLDGHPRRGGGGGGQGAGGAAGVQGVQTGQDPEACQVKKAEVTFPCLFKSCNFL